MELERQAAPHSPQAIHWLLSTTATVTGPRLGTLITCKLMALYGQTSTHKPQATQVCWLTTEVAKGVLFPFCVAICLTAVMTPEM